MGKVLDRVMSVVEEALDWFLCLVVGALVGMPVTGVVCILVEIGNGTVFYVWGGVSLVLTYLMKRYVWPSLKGLNFPV